MEGRSLSCPEELLRSKTVDCNGTMGGSSNNGAASSNKAVLIPSSCKKLQIALLHESIR